jgi:lysozyme
MDSIDKLTDLLKEFEGCQLKAYRCPAGIWTCGWGQTGADIKKNTVWTQGYADYRLSQSA